MLLSRPDGWIASVLLASSIAFANSPWPRLVRQSDEKVVLALAVHRGVIVGVESEVFQFQRDYHRRAGRLVSGFRQG
jgi:hypothetical protein